MQSTFGHHLNQIAKAEPVTLVPAHTKDDHFPVEVSPCIKRGRRLRLYISNNGGKLKITRDVCSGIVKMKEQSKRRT
jgi:hypothetical protein